MQWQAKVPYPQVKNGNSKALRGYTYILPDKGPMKCWLQTIGRGGDNKCKCGETQNGAHLLKCTEIEGGGKTREQIEEDPEWCERVVNLLAGNWTEEW